MKRRTERAREQNQTPTGPVPDVTPHAPALATTHPLNGRTHNDRTADHAVQGYASGEDRLRESAGMSERARSGRGTAVVPTNEGGTVADGGHDAEGGRAVA